MKSTYRLFESLQLMNYLFESMNTVKCVSFTPILKLKSIARICTKTKIDKTVLILLKIIKIAQYTVKRVIIMTLWTSSNYDNQLELRLHVYTPLFRRGGSRVHVYYHGWKYRKVVFFWIELYFTFDLGDPRVPNSIITM